MTLITHIINLFKSPTIINTPHTLSILLNQFSRLQSQLTQQQSPNHTLQSQVNLLNNPNLTEEQIQIEEQLASTISPTQTQIKLGTFNPSKILQKPINQ